MTSEGMTPPLPILNYADRRLRRTNWVAHTVIVTGGIFLLLGLTWLILGLLFMNYKMPPGEIAEGFFYMSVPVVGGGSMIFGGILLRLRKRGGATACLLALLLLMIVEGALIGGWIYDWSRYPHFHEITTRLAVLGFESSLLAGTAKLASWLVRYELMGRRV